MSDRIHSMARFADDNRAFPNKVKSCAFCDAELNEYEEVVFDSRTGLYFCTDRCFKYYLLNNINDEVYEFISLLRDKNEVSDKVLKAGGD